MGDRGRGKRKKRLVFALAVLVLAAVISARALMRGQASEYRYVPDWLSVPFFPAAAKGIPPA
jgi:hypothetical protein